MQLNVYVLCSSCVYCYWWLMLLFLYCFRTLYTLNCFSHHMRFMSNDSQQPAAGSGAGKVFHSFIRFCHFNTYVSCVWLISHTLCAVQTDFHTNRQNFSFFSAGNQKGTNSVFIIAWYQCLLHVHVCLYFWLFVLVLPADKQHFDRLIWITLVLDRCFIQVIT